MGKDTAKSKESREVAVMNRLLRTYCINLGEVAFEWNNLQELLGIAFSKILNARHPIAAATIWHALPSDRTQRLILRELIVAFYRPENLELAKAANPNITYLIPFGDELIWAIDTIDNKYSNKRNNAVHIPMNFFGLDASDITLVPDVSFFNKRSIKFLEKDLIEEMKNCALNLNYLHFFVCDLLDWFDANDFSRSLPKRPQLLEIPVAKRRKASRG
jgi:hypothetical protein